MAEISRDAKAEYWRKVSESIQKGVNKSVYLLKKIWIILILHHDTNTCDFIFHFLLYNFISSTIPSIYACEICFFFTSHFSHDTKITNIRYTHYVPFSHTYIGRGWSTVARFPTHFNAAWHAGGCRSPGCVGNLSATGGHTIYCTEYDRSTQHNDCTSEIGAKLWPDPHGSICSGARRPFRLRNPNGHKRWQESTMESCYTQSIADRRPFAVHWNLRWMQFQNGRTDCLGRNKDSRCRTKRRNARGLVYVEWQTRRRCRRNDWFSIEFYGMFSD